MSDERVRVDGECRSVLGELWATPVGRRWLLKAGLASAASAVAVRPWPAAAAEGGRRRGLSRSTLHFALGAAAGVSELTLVANGARLPLVEHSAASRRALRRRGGLWGAMDLSALTHYVPAVALPADRGMVVSVHGRRGEDEVVVAQLWRVPPRATRALARAARRLTGSLGGVAASPKRLKALGLRPSHVRSAAHVVQLEAIADPHQTAVAMTMLHPQVATVDPTASAATKALLGQTPAVQGLGANIARLQGQGEDFATLVQATDADGSPSQIKIGDTTTTFSTIRLNSDDRGFVAATRSAVSAGIVGVRDTAGLGAVVDRPLDQLPPTAGRTWVQPEGVAPKPQRSPPSLGAGIDIDVKNKGFLFGTRTEVTGPYAGGRVPLRIYNNYVRWMWLYVQYLGKGDPPQNLSANPNATFPDTKYSKSLAICPQVFTVLGVPLWDTNTVDVTLEFPEGAHTARLLYCGLGNDAVGGGWRHYFPTDAYPDRIAPTDEVLVASLTTGIFTIGLNAFALATDLDIAAAFGTVRKAIQDNDAEAQLAFETVLGTERWLTATETFAAVTVAGGATYLDIANSGENLNNLWSILLGLGSVIPKVLFNAETARFFQAVAASLVAEESAEKLIDAIPVVGEVLAIVEAVGDAATLAEVAVETATSPWVIENEVNLSYAATVTVSRDPRAASWPATARSWRLEAKVDGALTLDPVTGSVNEGGRTRSDPIVANVTAPFGGRQIQWSFVMLDGPLDQNNQPTGNQVGTGVSAQLGNDDPAAPPAAVSFAITELPATITASTVFRRADTTTFSATAGGYAWSDQVASAGTRLGGGVDEVAGAAVATRLGVAGAVWRQGGRYFLRGVPVAENGATIALGAARREGYARRPFVLFDSFVGAGDAANHVLVEPDETSDAYHVRKLSLDPRTGAIDWDPTVSYGTFGLPVSAAALHSSGRVVAVHTDSGRLGRIQVQPVATPRPQLAAYSAGPGDQVGLLSSPVAVAVTNPGVVLVLEAGASQLAAFDLNGNPVRYFGTQLGFTVPLASPGTYLDLAVDGAAQIYLLYYTGDGSAPRDYRVDVYTQAGAPLATNSPGVNVPRLAVDYWRSIYAPNYDPLTELGTTNPHVDPALGVPEPSLSRFDPRAAATTPRPRRRRRRRRRPPSPARR